MADPGSSLDRTEHLLWRLITAPEGVAKGLVAEGDPDGTSLAEVLASDERLSAVERLDIYANMYFARLHDVLRDDFPVLARLIGPARFHNLVTDYLLAHPPRHFSLRSAGAPLTGFVAAHPLAAERPWLADLAALEWAVVDVFDERDASTIDASALATVAPDEWPGLRFETIPALRILDLEWSVQATWLAAQSRPDPHPDHEADVPCEGPSHDRDADLPEPAARPVSMRVWRADHQALNREIGEDERAALGSLRDRRPFGEICEAVGALVGDEAAPARVATLLATWLADGLISRVVGGGS